MGGATARAKALGQDLAWRVGGTAGRPLRLEQSEQGGESGGAGGAGTILRFTPREGLWAEEGLALTQVLTDALSWLLWGGQALGGVGGS